MSEVVMIVRRACLMNREASLETCIEYSVLLSEQLAHLDDLVDSVLDIAGEC